MLIVCHCPIFFIELPSAHFYSLQSSAFVSFIYTSQPLRSVSLYSSLSLFLHSASLPSWHFTLGQYERHTAKCGLFLCVAELLDVGQRKEDFGCCAPMFFTKNVDRAIGKVETIGPAAFPPAIYLGQLMVPGTDPDLHPASSLHRKLNTK